MANLLKRLTMAIVPQPICLWPECKAAVTDRLDGVPLCGEHCIQVYSRMAALLDPERVHAWLKTQPSPRPKPESPQGYVYVIRLGDRVKIGHSLNPTRRFKQIPLEEVLAVISGSSADEKAAHRKFAHLRTTGEWFKAEPSLLDWARQLTPRTQ